MCVHSSNKIIYSLNNVQGSELCGDKKPLSELKFVLLLLIRIN